MVLPKELTTVTRTSKVLALIMIVALPFIGFYIGYQYGQLGLLASQGLFTTVPVASSTIATHTVSTTPTVPKTTKPTTKTSSQSTASRGTVATPTPSAPSCYVTNCHGTSITCGTKPSTEMCTATYQLGDFCRQFEKCVSANNSCAIVKDPKYQQCLGCVQNCAALYPNDSQKALQCETQQCRNVLQ